jgi:maltooligosyltrehalose trehalohydrolase
MRPDGGGWWAAEGPEGDYGFSLDGGPVRADPRSGSQPHGPEGPSRAVDHGAFRWTDGSWRNPGLGGAVLYEVHVGTFSAAGTFDGAVGHLPELVELGVDGIEVMPVAGTDGRWGWGYDGVNLYAPHHAYGGPDGFKRLVDACHGVGLMVVLDVVYNHLGPAGNHLGEFGPYFSDRHRTAWGDGVNYDEGEVRRWAIDNALMWVRDYHVDGLRCDAVHAIPDPTLHADLNAAVHGAGAFTVAEDETNRRRVVEPDGFGYDAVWADDFHHALHTVLTGERDGYYADFGPVSMVAEALAHGFVYRGQEAPHLGRPRGEPTDGLAADRFVVCLQNHDQIGNRATGDRITALAPVERVKVAVAVTLLSPFTVLLFQGEEWGASSPFLYFADHPDPALADAVRDGRRGEFAAFGWSPGDVPDPGDVATFERSKLDRSERGGELLDWYRRLLAVRRSIRVEGLRIGDIEAAAVGGVVTARWAGFTLVADVAGRAVEAPRGDVLFAGPGVVLSRRG